jgi:hypothetical protein
MNRGPAAPPLPPPPPPEAAAGAVSKAARVVADVWAQPMEPAVFGRAICQLYSVLRDLGIATTGLARYQITGHPADPSPPGFSRFVISSARHLVVAGQSLNDVDAAEGLGPVPDPDEPGTVLCRAARTAITAWRQPAGSSVDCDVTVGWLITAIGSLSAATQCLITCAPPQRTTELYAVDAELVQASTCLARAVRPPADDLPPGPRRSGMADGGRA